MSFTARDASQSCYFNEANQSPSQDALPMSPGRILKATLTTLPARNGLEVYYIVPGCLSK